MTSISLQTRINQNKQKIIDRLKTLPLVQIACQQIGIGRATYYRWRQDDPEFSQTADKSLAQGRLFINDMAESQLLSQIKDQNMTAIIFWLKHNHPIYGNRLEIVSDKKEEAINPEEAKMIKKALALGSLTSAEEAGENEKSQKSSTRNIK